MKGVKAALTFIGGALYASLLWLAGTSPYESWQFAAGLIPGLVLGGLLVVWIAIWLTDHWNDA